MKEPELQGFDTYGQPFFSPLLSWLPLFTGFVAATCISWMTCPVPRPPTLSGWEALFISTRYAMTTVVVGGFALAAVHRTTSAKSQIVFKAVLLWFCGAAVWFAPAVVFFARRSNWAISMAAVLAASATALIHSYYSGLQPTEVTAPSGSPRDIFHPAVSTPSRLRVMICVAFCAQFAIVSAISGRPRLAAGVLAAGVVLITWFYKSAVASDKFRSRTFASHALQWFSAVGLAVAFTAAGLIPYLSVESGAGGHQRLTQRLSSQERLAGDEDFQSTQQGYLQRARAVLSAFLANTALHRGNDGDGKETATGLTQAVYSALDELFGDEAASPAADARTPGSRSKRDAGPVAIGGSYPGVILWRKVKHSVTLVAPPLPERRVFATRGYRQKSRPLTIPFLGAYSFFRTSDGGLPANSFESRGDPEATSFMTTDMTPLSMEARQNLASLIDLSCCRAIQVTFTNRDLYPGTISLELILVNTTMPGHPSQSLGRAPVNTHSSRRPTDTGAPSEQTVSFSVPAHPVIEKFDEVLVRFELGSPREYRSARMAIDRLRFIPRGL